MEKLKRERERERERERRERVTVNEKIRSAQGGWRVEANVGRQRVEAVRVERRRVEVVRVRVQMCGLWGRVFNFCFYS